MRKINKISLSVIAILIIIIIAFLFFIYNKKNMQIQLEVVEQPWSSWPEIQQAPSKSGTQLSSPSKTVLNLENGKEFELKDYSNVYVFSVKKISSDSIEIKSVKGELMGYGNYNIFKKGEVKKGESIKLQTPTLDGGIYWIIKFIDFK